VRTLRNFLKSLRASKSEATTQPALTLVVASCLNPACRHTALIEVWSYPAGPEIPYFKSRVVCAKCGSRGNKIDVRPNWKRAAAEAELDREGLALKRSASLGWEKIQDCEQNNE
jgi:hypothetical protein